MRRTYVRLLYFLPLILILYIFRLLISPSSLPSSPSYHSFSQQFPPPRLTDPRWDGYAIGLKTGVETALDRVPIQLMTFMKGVKNYFIFGEIGGVKIADEEMVDVYTGAYEDATRRIESKENKRRLPGNDERGNIAKRSPQGEHGDKPFDHINTVMPTNEHSHDLGAEGYPHKDELHTLSSSHKSVDEAVSATHNDSTLPPKSHDFYSIHKRSVKEVPQFNQFPSKIDKDRQPDKKNQGWKLDAHKNLPALRAMYYRFPTAKWYIMIDDDTYLFMENLHHRLSKYNHNLPIYIGFPNHFVGCDGIKKYGTGPPFAHGGSGIVISRGAMLKVIDHIDECTLKYKDCWAGDVRIGLCLRDNGVNISFRMYQLEILCCSGSLTDGLIFSPIVSPLWQANLQP